MACILFASEFGSNLGHLGQLLPLASELQALGHEVVFALRDVTRADALLRPRGFKYLQAPLWHPRGPRNAQPPCSYSEILQQYGFRDREGLLGVVNAWRELYALVEPQAILFEYAPTALLASRSTTPITRFLYGDSFALPPRVSPFPNFRKWEQIPQQRLEASDAAVLDVANWVLVQTGTQPMESLQALFTVDEEFLCAFQELDHYAQRPNARYSGPVFTSNDGIEPRWPAGGDKRVYVYLRPGMPGFELVAQHLSESPHAVLWFAPGVTPDISQRFDSARFKFTSEPVRLSDTGAAADAAVLYAGHGTVSAMLLAGVPMALFPVHTEQALVAHNVMRLGAGFAAPPGGDANKVATMLDNVLNDPRFKQRASAFAAKYADYDPRQTVMRIAHSIESLLRPED